MKDMKLGLQLGYWGAGPPPNAAELVVEAEGLGFDSVWTAESYGSDALTPLAWWGSQTSRVRLGTSLCQLSARTPTAMGMAAITMDHLSGGRFVLGLGVSGPQVVEGWYGQSFTKPLARTRRVRRHRSPGRGPRGAGDQRRAALPPPLPGGHRTRQAPQAHRPSRSATTSRSSSGPKGPKNVALAAEIADGWFPIFFSPGPMKAFEASLAEGFARPGARHSAGRLRSPRLRPRRHRRRRRFGRRRLAATPGPLHRGHGGEVR